MASTPTLYRPRTLAEAIELLATVADARPLSGGASLVAMMNAGLVMPAALVSLTRIPELSGIRVSADGDIRIGAATRHNEIAGDGRLCGTAAVLSHAATQIAGTAVRNMGTIGGAVAHADPGLDFPPALFAVDATVEIASRSGRRHVSIREFFVDWYTTVLAPDEIAAAIQNPQAEARRWFLSQARAGVWRFCHRLGRGLAGAGWRSARCRRWLRPFAARVRGG